MITEPKMILYIEDDEGTARLVRQYLEQFGYMLEVAYSAEEGLKKFDPKIHELILMDYALPGISGLDALRKLTPDKFDPAVVLITAAGSEQVAVDAINNGAAGYVVKDSSLGFLSLLPIAIESGVAKQKLYKQISTLMNQATQNERKIAKLTAENEKLRVMNSTAQQKYFDTVHVH